MSALTDAYLAAVAANLPKKDRADITAELKDVLLSTFEAKEEALDRPLDRKDEEALLREFGHPLAVAGRYGRFQHLIGPKVFPFYVFALKMTAAVIAVVYIAVFGVSAVLTEGHGHPPQNIVVILLMAFAIITMMFFGMEHTGAADRMAARWKPSQLPLLGAPRARRMFDVLFEVALTVIMLAWWVGLVHFPEPGGRGFNADLAPIWTQLFWPILAFFVVQIAAGLFELVASGMVRTHAVIRGVIHLASLPVLYLIWKAGKWVVIQPIPGRPEATAKMETAFNSGFQIGFGIAMIVVVIVALASFYRAWRQGTAPNR